MNSGMELPLANIEPDQTFDYKIVAQLAEVIAFLPNIEG
jgi:hypothetical protein